MAWDSSRPVPWQRLVREWLVYVAIMAVVFVVFFRDDGLVGILGGLLASGPLYLAIGYALAKLGYRRQTLGEIRERSSERRSGRAGGDRDVGDRDDRPRPKPAPTRRTGGGAQRRPTKRRR